MITLLSLATAALVSVADCQIDANVIGARYEISRRIGEQEPTTHQFNIWRNGDQVALERPDQNLTEIWNRLRDKRIRPVRYFDAYQRAIEYQPSDIINASALNWDSKYQIVATATLASMTHLETTASACDSVAKLERKSEREQLSIDWLPAYQLPQLIKQTTSSMHTEWRLVELVTDTKRIRSEYERRSDYLSIDYADIGDNESDPFLAKMIRMGFIEHGASGMYNADGSAIDAHTPHRH